MSEFWQGFVEGCRAAPRIYFMPLTALWRLLARVGRASLRKVRRTLA
jgi:hypothetical protein